MDTVHTSQGPRPARRIARNGAAALAGLLGGVVNKCGMSPNFGFIFLTTAAATTEPVPENKRS